MSDEVVADLRKEMEGTDRGDAPRDGAHPHRARLDRAPRRHQVEYYGTKTPLNQLASLSAPEPRLLVIQPYDRSAISDIERAILQSDLGLCR